MFKFSSLQFDEAKKTCLQTRKIALDTLTEVLGLVRSSDAQISEFEFRNLWWKQFRKHGEIFPDGWYDPPPHGIGVLFGTEATTDRVSPQSLRSHSNWPSKNVFLDKSNGLIFVYASPVDRKTGIIGDFGLTLYLGRSKKIQNHLRTCYHINEEVFNSITIGMKFKELNVCTHTILNKYGLVSDLVSPSDVNKTNTGHTIPGFFEGWTNEEAIRLSQSDWSDITSLISKKRKFINSTEELKIQPGMAFTIEPRPYSATDTSIPMAWFHMICMIDEQGQKELVSNFKELFTIAGMKFMFK